MYTAIPEEVIENVRQENDIVDVVEEYVQLKKQGRNYFGLCPFHDEKSPSFSVTKDKQIFHCFGCGKGGNVITFLMEMESFSFMDTITHLAQRAGINLPEQKNETSRMSEEANTVLSAHEWLAKYYHHMLRYAEHGKEAREYLKERGISEETIDEFQIGYAPTNSEWTVDFLLKKGFHSQTLVKAGLLSTRDNQEFMDVFRGRVIFPINNHLGRTIAFGGRSFRGEEPKYLNSPEHELFQKGNMLYHFHAAKNHIRKQQQVIIFEGYMDVIAAGQAGIKNGVATLGTALTMQQAKLLKRYVDTVIISYDADSAGIQASFEAASLLQQLQCDVKIASVADNMDPDEYIRTYGGKQFIEQVIDLSDSFFSFYMRYKKRQYNLKTDSERIAYIEDVIKQLAFSINSSIEMDYYVKEIADEFNLSTDIIYHDIEKHQKRIRKGTDNERQNSNTNSNQTVYRRKSIYQAFENAEKKLLTYMFKNPYVLEKVQHQLGVQFNLEAHKIILTYLYALYEEDQVINISKLLDKLTDPNLRTIVTELSMAVVSDDINDQEIQDYIHVIRWEQTEVSYIKELEQKQKREANPILAAKIGLEIIALKKQEKQR